MLEPDALAICITSVTYSEHIDYALSIEDLVDDPPISDTNAPEVLCTLKLRNAVRTWVMAQRLDLSEDAKGYWRIKGFEFLPRRARERNGVLRHAASA
jgi:hypothetical protein